MTQTPRPAVQDPDGPDFELVAQAAIRLREIFRDPSRSKSDKRKAVDALGRALLRLKEHIR